MKTAMTSALRSLTDRFGEPTPKRVLYEMMVLNVLLVLNSCYCVYSRSGPPILDVTQVVAAALNGALLVINWRLLRDREKLDTLDELLASSRRQLQELGAHLQAAREERGGVIHVH